MRAKSRVVVVVVVVTFLFADIKIKLDILQYGRRHTSISQRLFQGGGHLT